MTQLEKYYNKFKEDHRLTTRHGIVEFTVSMKYIHDYIASVAAENGGAQTAGVRILDVGAGTGRYSVALAQEGHDVTAVELVPHNLELLRAKHAKVKTWLGNAMNLHFLADGTFDITLLFGPLYHLHDEADKLKALAEAKRVTKKGGYIFVAYLMNEYAVLSYCFKEGHIKKCLQNKTLTADFHALTETEKDLYSYTRLEDMNRLNKAADLTRAAIFAPDGAADYMRRELNALDEESFRLFIEYQKAICERPELLGASSHIVDVLKK